MAVLLSRSTLKPLISLDLVGTKSYCFRARLHYYYFLYNIFSANTVRRSKALPGDPVCLMRHRKCYQMLITSLDKMLFLVARYLGNGSGNVCSRCTQNMDLLTSLGCQFLLQVPNTTSELPYPCFKTSPLASILRLKRVERHV